MGGFKGPPKAKPRISRGRGGEGGPTEQTTGEELCVDYIDVRQSRRARQAELSLGLSQGWVSAGVMVSFSGRSLNPRQLGSTGGGSVFWELVPKPPKAKN